MIRKLALKKTLQCWEIYVSNMKAYIS